MASEGRLTITTISKDRTGADVMTVGVYEKQRERQ
jgi:hypothetical protein